MTNQIIQGDCLEVMKDIPDKSIDMILCDLPYGTTACKWDTIIPFEPLWEQYKRVIKDNGAIVLTASQPFTSALVMSNIKWFKYEWIWEKSIPSGMFSASYQPMKNHENILVFSKSKTKFNPIKEERSKNTHKTGKGGLFKSNSEHTKDFVSIRKEPDVLRNPTTVKLFPNVPRHNSQHPTQKPVALFEYLIKTYTNEGDLVLDNCAGSGTTGVACINTNRNYILIEKEKEYIDIINKRLANND
jgi:site-specific DNA-methyltransferase (adenine-specific)